MLQKIITYGRCLLAFLLPWQTRLIFRAGNVNGGYFEYGSLSVYGTDLLLLLLIFLLTCYEIILFQKGKSGFFREKGLSFDRGCAIGLSGRDRRHGEQL